MPWIGDTVEAPLVLMSGAVQRLRIQRLATVRDVKIAFRELWSEDAGWDKRTGLISIYREGMLLRNDTAAVPTGCAGNTDSVAGVSKAICGCL